MADPICLLVLLTLCGTCAMGVSSYALGVPSDHQYTRYYIGEGSAASRTPVNHSVDLSLHLLRHLYTPSHNLVFSPYSLVTALTMTLLGAEDHSRRQLMETLFGSENRFRLKQFITQHGQLTKDSAEQLTMGNFLYSDKSFPLKSEYSKEIAANLSGIVKSLSFADDPSSAMETINSDVSEATHGLIPRLLTEPSHPGTALFLLNTVNFKGTWAMPFNETRTDLQGTFTTSGGQVMRIPMMHHYRESVPFLEQKDGTKCLLLPYTVPDLYMAFLLPPEGQPISSFLGNLTGAFIAPLLEDRFGGSRRSVTVALPRFKVSRTHASLVGTLRSLGVADLFTPGLANLGKLTQKWEELYVNEVLQVATIEVNEEGREGGVATPGRAILVSRGRKEVQFIADRPFVYALLRAPSFPEDSFLTEHMQILLMGVVEDPRKE